MTVLTREPDLVQTWLADFRACLRGEHGGAWRSRAECEVRAQNAGASTAISMAAVAASWRRVRAEFFSQPEAG